MFLSTMKVNVFAMPLPSLLLILSAIFSRTEALPWAGPEPTAAYVEDRWSPRPTNAPTDPGDLFKRSSIDVAVCGWIGGQSSNAAVCARGSSCVHDTAHGYVGCCTTSGSCTAGVYTTCIDHHSKGWKSNPVWQNNGIYTCPGTSECYQNAYPGGYSQWACGSATDATTIQTTYSGQPGDLLLQLMYTAVTFHPKTRSAMKTSSTSSSTRTSKSSSTSSSTTTSAPSSTSSPSPTSTDATAASSNKSTVGKGVIAAAVVAPILLIAFILGAFIWWRKREPTTQYIKGPESPTGEFASGNVPDNNPGDPSGQPQGMQLVPDAPPLSSQQQPFSPDDYVSPMTIGASTTSASRAVISPPDNFGSIEDRMLAAERNPYAMPEESRFVQPGGAVSEIEHFSGAYIAAIGGLSPTTPHQAPGSMQNNQPGNRETLTPHTWLSSLKGVDGTSAPPVPQIPKSIPLVITNASRMRDDSLDPFAELEKETRGIPTRKTSVEPFPLYDTTGLHRPEGQTVKAEGWAPSELRPNKLSMKSPNRYELVDEVPDINDGAQVLHEPGQLRKNSER